LSKRLVIVGGGMIGLSVAYFCARRGCHVTVLDRNPATRTGCSFGNAGMVVPSHFIPLAAPGVLARALKWLGNPASPLYLRPRLDAEFFRWGLHFMRAANVAHVQRAGPVLRDMALASRQWFEEFAKENDFGLEKRGLLMLCQTQHALDEEATVAEQARALGIPADVLEARQVAALDPGARLDVVGAVHFPLDCQLVPERLMAALQAHCEKLGVKCVWNTEVREWRMDGARIRAAAAVEGDEFVLCGGAWSAALGRPLGLNIPLQAGKGYSLTLSKPRQLPAICSLLTEARVAVTPMGRALRVGGTMEFDGLTERINPVRIRGIVESFCRYFPDFRAEDFAGLEPWCGLRPCSPDGLPYLGRTAKCPNLLVATGHAMLGTTLGPVTGQLIADMVAGEKPRFDLALLSPDRYSRSNL
jgi:D-amino-acid dehydrogenase